ncbi:hypothetical protein E2C01_072877 [Portunus trituberculatus]|uniref:Uncharacterized protein n=1 Tax=Portunus trituberculatus TaxID=210409 RepID=A0A5B7I3Q5_PORTR|nr:hypothetical protein [Portunus trituberculatus]
MSIRTDVASVTGRNVPPWDQDKPQVLAAPAADFWDRIGGSARESPHGRVLAVRGLLPKGKTRPGRFSPSAALYRLEGRRCPSSHHSSPLNFHLRNNTFFCWLRLRVINVASLLAGERDDGGFEGTRQGRRRDEEGC